MARPFRVAVGQKVVNVCDMWGEEMYVVAQCINITFPCPVDFLFISFKPALLGEAKTLG